MIIGPFTTTPLALQPVQFFDATPLGCRYDVELYQRIEKLIGQKLEEFATEQELVLLLLERVSEAQRMATMQVSAPTLIVAESPMDELLKISIDNAWLHHLGDCKDHFTL